MSRLIAGYCRLIEWAIGAALAVMVVLVFGNVVLRYAFNSGITVSEELSRWLFVWMTFLGAVVAMKEHAHLGTDVLVSRLGIAGKKACLVAGHVMMLYAAWLIFSGSLAQTRINWDVQAPVTGASVALFYASGMAFAVSAAVLLALELARTLTGRASEKDLLTVQDSEESAQLEGLRAGGRSAPGEAPPRT
ncbi:MAG TPA: TRAP transporter small permease [Burkholderiales bacterium]|nr:TRAP transporter small permease [Burkholderiales bacterium]